MELSHEPSNGIRNGTKLLEHLPRFRAPSDFPRFYVLICWAETVNLSDVNKNLIASEEIGRSISNVPERHYLFGKLKEDFNEVRNKCEMAIDSAGTFFQSPFLNIPLYLVDSSISADFGTQQILGSFDFSNCLSNCVIRFMTSASCLRGAFVQPVAITGQVSSSVSCNHAASCIKKQDPSSIEIHSICKRSTWEI